MSYAIGYVVTFALCTACVWGVARWAGFRVPTPDLLLITGVCSGIALLPGAGWILAMLVLSLLIAKTTDADAWPDAVLIVTGCGAVWVLSFAALATFTS